MVAIDYGIKRNILRLLASAGCKITVVPATTSADDIMALKPDGVFLANGPGDPAETGKYAVPVIRTIIDKNIPTFGICLGHQMLGIALGGKTVKMHQGHHGANHPVKDLTTGKVEITSMNHGFAVDKDSPAEECRADAYLAVRRHQCRHRAQGQAGLLGAISPGSLARPARQPLPVQAVHRFDARAQARLIFGLFRGGRIKRLLKTFVLEHASPKIPQGPPDVHPQDQAADLPVSPMTASCRTIRSCRSWSIAARSILPARRIRKSWSRR